MKLIRATFACFFLLTVLTGVVYPLLITGIAKIVFPNQADGSLIDKSGKPTPDEKTAVGSALLGQTFDAPHYFWSRPSATSPQPYNASGSSGSNLGPTNSALTDAVKARIDTLHQADPGNTKPIPVDLVTASGSGLDPQESIAAAEYQVARIAAIRKADPAAIEALIAQNTVSSVFTESAVNVLQLNLALDAACPYAPTTSSAPASSPAPAAAAQ